MQRLVCPHCGYAKTDMPGHLTVVIEARITVTLDRNGKPKPALSRRVNIQQGELEDEPTVQCPNCGEEFKVMDAVKFGCSSCGKEIPIDELDNYFCRSALDIRCPKHIDTYYCEGCSYRDGCKLYELTRSG